MLARRDTPLPPLDCPLLYDEDDPSGHYTDVRHPLCEPSENMRHPLCEPSENMRHPLCGPSENVRHPLRGIVAALHRVNGAVVVLGCDMPFVPPALLGLLAALDEVAVASVNGTLQPLLARYTPEMLPALERALAGRAPLRRTVEALHPRVLAEDQLSRFGDPHTICFNVNDRSDLARAERLLRGQPSPVA